MLQLLLLASLEAEFLGIEINSQFLIHANTKIVLSA